MLTHDNSPLPVLAIPNIPPELFKLFYLQVATPNISPLSLHTCEFRFHVTHYQFISGFFSSHFLVYDAMSPSLHNIMVLYVAQVCCPAHSFRSSRSVYFKFRILRLYEHFPVLKLPFCRARDSLLGTKPLKGWRGA